MADSAAALLDELMGKHRNVLPNEKFQEKSWEEPDVCKDFLCGFCPNQLFTNTRSDLGVCDKVHDEHLRKEFLKSPPSKIATYEDMFFNHLQRIMGDVDKRIRRGQARLAMSQKKDDLKLPSHAKEEEKIKILTERINELLAKVEELGCQGNVDEAQGMMKLCDQLKEERDQLQSATEQAMELLFSQEKQMEVCQICGAFLIVNDSQSRVDDHLMGKQHMGYARIKATLEEMKNKRMQEQIDRNNHLLKEREDREKAREKERVERQRKRDEERDRERDRRDRHKDRDRDRSRRSRSHSRRSRSRSRDRKRSRRSRSRDRKRSRSRDRDRERDRKSRRSRSRDRKRSRSKERRRGSHSRSRRSRSGSRSRHSRHRSEERKKEDRGSRKGSREREEAKEDVSNGQGTVEEGEIDSKPAQEDKQDKTPDGQDPSESSPKGKADPSPTHGKEDKTEREEGEAEDKD